MAQVVLDTYFKDDLVNLSFHPAANFPLQRILERLAKPDDVTFVAKTLLGRTAELIGNNPALR
jgi:hypothetical protein